MNTQAVSLYLQLEKGWTPDLEVVARTSLAYAATAREIAFQFDPGLDIRIELASTGEGSLFINSVLRNLRNKKGESLTLGAIALLLAGWFAHEVTDYTFEKLADAIFHHEEHQLSDADKDDIAQRILIGMDKHIGEKQAQRVYREADRDPVISGVGVSLQPNVRPAVIVPRSDFRVRAGLASAVMTSTDKRVQPELATIVVVRPVLVRDGARRWRFRSDRLGEFSATVKDADFLDTVLTGRTLVPMAENVELLVEMEVHEERHEGVWRPTEYIITHVRRVTPPPFQAPLPFTKPDMRKPEDDR